MAKQKAANVVVDNKVHVALDGALAGHHVLIDTEELTWGLLEDLQSGQHGLMLDAVARCIAGGDLPHGTDRGGLRQLKPEQVTALLAGVGRALRDA